MAYSPCTSSFGAASSSSSPPSTRCLLPRLPLPSSSFSSSPRTTARRRNSGMVTATSLSLFPSAIFHSRGIGRDSPLSSYTFPSTAYSIRFASQSAAAAAVAAAARNTTNANTNPRKESDKKQLREEEEVEEEEDLPWIQEKALDLVEFTGSVTQAIPGPRVGRSSLPWILAIPLAYVTVSFVIAFLKTLRNFNSPKAIRRKLVNKNAMLCKSIDELLEKGIDGVQQSSLEGLMQKTGFGMGEILRKYIRYALNEKPFNPDLVANLIQLRKASSLDDSLVAEIINDISRRIVKDRGPVVMDMSGYSEKGFKRKLAVQNLFGKIYYLSELPEFCSRDNSLIVKEIFGVADEDAEKLRMHTLSEAGDVDSLEKMINDGSDSEIYSSDGSSNAL